MPLPVVPRFKFFHELPQGFAVAGNANNAAFRELCRAVFKSQKLKAQIDRSKQRVKTLTVEN